MTITTSSPKKVAWIRNQDVPVGHPAPGHLSCPCGNSPESWFDRKQGDVLCECGHWYTWNGWNADGKTIHHWPYHDMLQNYADHTNDWRETDQKVFDDQLGCVPPIKWDGGFFMVGKCYTIDSGGRVYAVFGKVAGRYFGRLSHIKHFDPQKYTAQICAQYRLPISSPATGTRRKFKYQSPPKIEEVTK